MKQQLFRRTRIALLIAVLTFHYFVITLGITKPVLEKHREYWDLVEWYGKITGASASYSFFSPDIPREIVFQFKVYNRDKSTFETTLQKTANNEVNARVGNILRTIPKSFENKKVVRSLAASVTASMFQIYPDAEKIEIKGVLFMLPTMEEYRLGERTKFKKIYSATFLKESKT